MQRLSMRAAVLFALALPAIGFADSNVTLLRDGASIAEGEVCRFQAGDLANPFKRWMSSQNVTCVAAGAVAFPTGKWNVFGRLGGSGLSTTPVVIDGDAAPKSLSLNLVPAATLATTLPEGVAGVVYAPRFGSAFPVAAGTGRISVPAGEELWLIVVKKSLPIAIFPVAAVDAGSERAVSAQSAGGSFVIGWLHVPESDREALTKGESASAPHIRMTSGGPSQDSYPLPPLPVLHGSFFLVRAETAGEATLDFGGRGWIADRRRVKVAQAITVVEDPLQVRPSSFILVNWSAQLGLPALDRSIGSCEKNGEKPQQFEVLISTCPAPKSPREPVDTAECQAVRRETFPPDLNFGTMTVDDIPSGTYRVEIRFGKLPPVGEMVTALPMKQITVPINASYIELYGSLTFGDAPIGKDAVIKFPSGGIGFAPRESGEYRAALLVPVDVDTPINIATCEGEPKAIVFANTAAKRSARYDINIPDNALTVRVTDTFTGQSIAAASVRYVVHGLRFPQRPILTRMLKTDETGALEIKAVPERKIDLFVTRHGYQDNQVDPFSMSKSEKKNLDVQLVPLRGNDGKIDSQRPFESATLYWFSASGTVTDHADVGPDGTFIFGNAHGPDETMSLVSHSHPLWVVRSPDTRAAGRGQPFEIRFPDGPAHGFEVSLRKGNPRTITFIGLAIGGVNVPPLALELFQSLRHVPAVLTGDAPLPIRDLAETGTIDVILGPTVGLAGRMTDGQLIDWFANAPRKRLAPGMTTIVFEP